MYGIVIVEDEELERRALRKTLTENLADVEILGEAGTGPDAIALIDRCEIDLVLVDVNIPGASGIEVIRHLRQTHDDTSVIVTTAYDYFDLMHQAIHLRVDDYLLKPIRPQVLLKAVEACIRKSGGRKRGRDLARRLGGLLEQRSYRDAVAEVRHLVETCYARRDTPPRDRILEIADLLTELAGTKDLGISESLAQQVVRLRALQIDERNRNRVLTGLLGMVDQMFDAAGERFGESPERIQKALDFIERNLNKGVTLEEVADHVGLSACHLSRLFKKKMNINFIAYLTNRRLEVAKDMLRNSEMPITNVAIDLSYSDVNYFCKTFKKGVGLSPSEYRRQIGVERRITTFAAGS